MPKLSTVFCYLAMFFTILAYVLGRVLTSHTVTLATCVLGTAFFILTILSFNREESRKVSSQKKDKKRREKPQENSPNQHYQHYLTLCPVPKRNLERSSVKLPGRRW